jgi:hypothetical protein
MTVFIEHFNTQFMAALREPRGQIQAVRFLPFLQIVR